MFEKKYDSMHRVPPVKNAGDTRRGTYIFEDIKEAEAWDRLFPSREKVKKLIASDPSKVNSSEFINIEALNALCDRRSGNFVNPEFLEMLDSRLRQMGYDIVDECRRQGLSEIVMKQHVNYYYDFALETLKLRKIREEEFYGGRYGALEQVAIEYAQRKQRYAFVEEAKERTQWTGGSLESIGSQPGDN